VNYEDRATVPDYAVCIEDVYSTDTISQTTVNVATINTQEGDSSLPTVFAIIGIVGTCALVGVFLYFIYYLFNNPTGHKTNE